MKKRRTIIDENTFRGVRIREIEGSVTDGKKSMIRLAVAFLESESEYYGKFYGHGYARARIARRLKHVTLSDDQKKRLLAAIRAKFLAGRFQIQIEDWLRLGLCISPAAMRDLATEAGASEVLAVQSRSEWLLARVADKESQQIDADPV